MASVGTLKKIVTWIWGTFVEFGVNSGLPIFLSVPAVWFYLLYSAVQVVISKVTFCLISISKLN